MKKKLLEMILQELKDVAAPDPALEQYPTPADIASDLIFQAYGFGDITGKLVCEPGCGKGILSLGAALMGAEQVMGFDCDVKAVDVASLNLEYLVGKGYELDAEFFSASLPEYDSRMRWDTIVMNPPFGSQRPRADRPFMEFASKRCDVMYSLHLARTADFVVSYLEELKFNGEVLGIYTFPIKHTYSFHMKESMDFEVALVRGSLIE